MAELWPDEGAEATKRWHAEARSMVLGIYESFASIGELSGTAW